jgi:hypothetical protein
MPASTAPTVAVVGMRALRRDLNKAADDVSSPVYRAIKQAGAQAAEPVAARARAAVPRGPDDRLSGDIRVSGTKTGAAVRMGRVSIPYAGWIEFGGTRPDGSTRDYIPSGRYLFPAAAGLASTSAELYSTALDRILNSDAIWTNTTSNPEAVSDG